MDKEATLVALVQSSIATAIMNAERRWLRDQDEDTAYAIVAEAVKRINDYYPHYPE